MTKQTKKPVIKITKIFPPHKESVEKCHVSAHGDIECWFTVNGVKYVLNYNPKLAGYDGMPAEAGEHGSFYREIAGKSFNGQYAFDEASAKITLKTLLFSINCYAKREVGGISLLFESKKLLTVLQMMAALSGNETAQKLGELSKNYDGVRLGFDMKK